ncbi:MAG: hypothetical protein DRP78_03465 [Candidatus Omnitrophota bacterium]|nr:MAG: hypothetical protein DRP78_03465 [Candidatus Omnitrophota bacterium]
MAKKEESPMEAPSWIALYSSLMTLLMAFFIALTTLGTYGGQKFQKVVGSLQEAFSMFSSGGSGAFFKNVFTAQSGDVSISPASAKMDKSKLVMIMEHELQKENQEGYHNLKIDYASLNMIAVNINDTIIFNFNSSALTEEAKALLDKVIRVLNDQPYKLLVKGYCEKDEKNGGQWELSVDRAVNVIKYVHKYGNIGYERLSAQGFGGYQQFETKEDVLDSFIGGRCVRIVLKRQRK